MKVVRALVAATLLTHVAGCATGSMGSLTLAQSTARFERAAKDASVDRESEFSWQFYCWVPKATAACASTPATDECAASGCMDGADAAGKAALDECVRFLAPLFVRPSPARAVGLVRECMEAKGFERSLGDWVKLNLP